MIDYADFLDILLTALGVILTTLAVVIALMGVVGYSQIKKAAVRAAIDAAVNEVKDFLQMSQATVESRTKDDERPTSTEEPEVKR